MSDAPPHSFGKYRILKELGRGSFGVVYLVENTSLRDRREALKVLYPQLVVDADTLRLFAEEAGTLAQLDHPNIVTVFEAGEIDGRRFIAMRYVRGRSLAEVIRDEGAQPPGRVAEWLDQAASALDHAHGQGVLHRDVKPANILLDVQGRAVLTDLGMAKASGASGGSASQEMESVSGTVRYMAPEAFQGKASVQSDIYSLGVVLYELLTGQVPFDGPDFVTIALRHTTEEVRPLRELRTEIPAAVEAVVLRALAKQPTERFGTAGELARAFRLALGAKEEPRKLEDSQRRLTVPEHEKHETEEPAKRGAGADEGQGKLRLPTWVWLAGGALVALIILAVVLASLQSCRKGGPVIPPPTTEPPTLTHTPSPTALPTSTHTPTPTSTHTPSPEPSPFGGGNLIAFETNPNGDWDIYALNVDGGGLTNLTNHMGGDHAVAWSPDGAQIAFHSFRDGKAEVYVMSADGTGQVNLTNNLADDGSPSWSPDRSRIVFDSNRDGNSEIYVMKADGSAPINLSNNPAADYQPAWSPDGRRIAFHSYRDGNSEIYVMNADGTGQTRLTDSPAEDAGAAWSPDGQWIAFYSNRDDNYEVYVMNVDGSGQTNLSNHAADDGSPSWSPDGSLIAFDSDRDGNHEIYVMRPDGSAQTRWTIGVTSNHVPAWSPR